MARERYDNVDEALRAALALPDAQALSLTLPPAVLAADARLENPRFVGRGGMGSVYRAFDRSLGTEVAIKLVRPGRGARELLLRLRREAEALSALHHPNIVELLRVDEHEEQVLLVMRFIPGTTLRRELRTRLAPERSFSLTIALGGALRAAHTAGFVHGDFKPENVIVREDDTPCLVDFGLSRGATGANSIETFTRPGEILGTASYMAPEQKRGERANARSDQYSFGVTVHEMFAGARPLEHSGATPLPAALSLVLGRCMAENEADRFDSMADALAALEAIAPAPSPR